MAQIKAENGSVSMPHRNGHSSAAEVEQISVPAGPTMHDTVPAGSGCAPAKMKAAVPQGTPPSIPITKNDKGGLLYFSFRFFFFFVVAFATETLGKQTSAGVCNPIAGAIGNGPYPAQVNRLTIP